MYECINGSCEWVGKFEDTVVFKHDTKTKDGVLFCPKCYEVVEKIDKKYICPKCNKPQDYISNPYYIHICTFCDESYHRGDLK